MPHFLCHALSPVGHGKKKVPYFTVPGAASKVRNQIERETEKSVSNYIKRWTEFKQKTVVRNIRYETLFILKEKVSFTDCPASHTDCWVWCSSLIPG